MTSGRERSSKTYQTDVDGKVCTASSFEEDADWGDKDGEAEWRAVSDYWTFRGSTGEY